MRKRVEARDRSLGEMDPRAVSHLLPCLLNKAKRYNYAAIYARSRLCAKFGIEPRLLVKKGKVESLS